MPADIRAYLEIRTASPAGFSPDASTLLVSSDLSGTAQVHALDLDTEGRDLVQLTEGEDPVGGAFLPTGRRLLLSTAAGGNERHQLYLADPEPAAAWRDLVVDPEFMHVPGGVSRDGTWLAYSTNRGNGVDFDVWVRDLATGDERVVFTPGSWAGAAGYSPRATYLACTELTERSADNRVHLVRLATGEVTEVAPHPDEPGHVSGPVWLPDESAAYFSTNLGRDTAGIARLDPTTGAWEHVITRDGCDLSCAVDWTGTHLLVVANVDGWTEATLHDPRTLEPVRDVPLPGTGVAFGFSFSQDGRWLTFGYSSPLVPGDVWRMDLANGAVERLTTSPCEVDPSTFVEPELIRFTGTGDVEVPAFVFRPRAIDERDAGGDLPVVVMIHGGPESQYRPAFSALTQYLVAHGFAVIAPNVRGSTGYGKAYEHLDDQHKRLDSVADLASLHDWIAGAHGLDADRVALYGGSYGGYMVLAGLAFYPKRWAAGVNIVGISSLVTFLENTSDYRRRFREREYGFLDRDRAFLESASPITHVDQMQAPLFIIHGANDPRVPLGEAEQLHDILTAKGVRSELLVYPDEGHGLAKLANRIDAYPQVTTFLAEVLAP